MVDQTKDAIIAENIEMMVQRSAIDIRHNNMLLSHAFVYVFYAFLWIYNIVVVYFVKGGVVVGVDQVGTWKYIIYYTLHFQRVPFI